MGIRNVQSIQLRKRRKIGLKQALIYTHPFPLLPPPPTVARNSYLPPLQLNSQILFLGRKNWEGHLLPPRPLASYACVSILAEHLIKKTRNIDVQRPIAEVSPTILRLFNVLRRICVWDPRMTTWGKSRFALLRVIARLFSEGNSDPPRII